MVDTELLQPKTESNCLQGCALWISGMHQALFRYIVPLRADTPMHKFPVTYSVIWPLSMKLEVLGLLLQVYGLPAATRLCLFHADCESGGRIRA